MHYFIKMIIISTILVHAASVPILPTYNNYSPRKAWSVYSWFLEPNSMKSCCSSLLFGTNLMRLFIRKWELHLERSSKLLFNSQFHDQLKGWYNEFEWKIKERLYEISIEVCFSFTHIKSLKHSKTVLS